ncbi:ABC transporter ATP-binding protein [Hwanghaeella grinnelliae]|uniref:ABC transporter ATP-binding protein n=1 Tax=Hwanghaeella grinnelliae TaxID=2500179 RepID=A0A437QNJ4_9PROT|nr:ABC transporter ATP-binding protein [Hwanghaeella grinnelliae]RVU36106.1 ABC transporter ATP-binding protein [Hwanghaeella grinnelliae]
MDQTAPIGTAPKVGAGDLGATAQANPAVAVSHLTKQFGNVTAVDDVSFTVRHGETVALLGGNGAGKTTTLSMLLGLLLPTSGTIHVFGHDIATDRRDIVHRINFTSPYVDLPMRLTVQENLTVYARLYGLRDVKGRIAELAEDLDLGDFLKRPVKKLSAGQKTRVGLAKAMLNWPELLLLDEPTASLDPDTGDWVRTYLERYQAESGAAILLASHNMAEVERLAKDVLMMKAGRIVDTGPPRALIDQYGRKNLEEVFLDIARGTRSENGGARNDD